jgi:beta-glucosidase
MVLWRRLSQSPHPITAMSFSITWLWHWFQRASTLWKLIGLFLALILVAAFCTQLTSTTISEVDLRVTSILREMTFAEKIELLSGVGRGEIRAVPRLGLPQMTTADGPFGIRDFGHSTAVAGGIALAATWNTELAQRVGVQLGRDARARGVHFYLGPGVNIYRAPLAGRNWEYFGEDPYLASRMAVAVIEGVQSQGVASVIKHYLANNSEYDRHNVDAVIDERTAREIYLPAFEAAVREADVAGIMDAYNLVNGGYMTQNRHFNVDVLNEWGFRGIVMSDWGATHDTLAAANGGLDLEMPSGKYFTRDRLVPLVREGKVTMESINEKVRRILRTAVRFGWLDRVQPDTAISPYDAARRATALETAQEAIVLLKNDGILPLDRTRIRSIAVIGPDVYPAPYAGGGTSMLEPWHATTLLEGLSNEGPGLQLEYARGITDFGHLAAATHFTTAASGGRRGLKVELFANPDFSGSPAMRVDPSIGVPLDMTAFISTEQQRHDPSTLTAMPSISTRWTGYYTPGKAGEYDVFVQVEHSWTTTAYRLYLDNKLVVDHWSRNTALVQTARVSMDVRAHRVVLEYRADLVGLPGSVPLVRMGIVRVGDWVDATAKQFASQADAAIVEVGFDSTTEAENSDRTFNLPAGQDELIRTICSLQKRCVVIVTSGGAVDMRKWLDQVPGLLQSWYLGQEGGTALARLLLGSVNPSGHLPATFESTWEDNPVYNNYYPKPGTHSVRYAEGVYVGYRGFEALGIQPQFPFGYGLSYTTFEYHDLQLLPRHDSSGVLCDASFWVKNTGGRTGAAVAQLYVAPPVGSERPPKELKGFAKIILQPGESRKITLPLEARAFSHYEAAGGWRADAGIYQVLVGDTSNRISLHGEVTLPHAILANR